MSDNNNNTTTNNNNNNFSDILTILRNLRGHTSDPYNDLVTLILILHGGVCKKIDDVLKNMSINKNDRVNTDNTEIKSFKRV